MIMIFLGALITSFAIGTLTSAEIGWISVGISLILIGLLQTFTKNG